MNLINTSFWSAVSTVLKIFAGFVVNKLLAIYVGPTGVAVLGQFSNYTGMLTTFGNGGTNAGATKYIAEYGQDKQRQKDVVNTSLKIALFSSLLFGGVNFFFAGNLSEFLFHTLEYTIILEVFSISLVFASLNSTLLSVLNGYKQLKLFLGIGIINNFLGLTMTYLLVTHYAVFGALLSVVLTQSLIFFVTFVSVRKTDWFSFSFIKIRIDKIIAVKLSKYTIMALTSACVAPVSLILVRNYLTQQYSLDQAGYWQAVWKISEVYLMVITTSLATYYLPRLSEIVEVKELKKEIFRGYSFLLPITISMAAGIYILREYIILLLFTPRFMPMQELFLFQLIGDVLKISAWLLAFLMLAKAMTRLFIITEIVFNLSFVGLVYFCVGQWGLVGVTYAYAANYFLYLVTMGSTIGWKVLKMR